MAFTEYKFAPEAIRALVEERRNGLRANRGFSNLLAFGLGVVVERLSKDRRRYLDYGPYWWALKALMQANGHVVGGDQSDPLIARTYKGRTDEETLIMADEFRSAYLKRNAIYTSQFMLDGNSGEFWTLYDSDMESPA